MKNLNIQNNIDMWGHPDNWSDDGEIWTRQQFGTNQEMWDNVIYPRISTFLKGEVLEIAPGYGRVTEKLLDYDINLEIVDLNSNCIDRCRERFGDQIQGYFTNTGKDLHDFTSKSKDFILSWDSFVHMDETVVEPYLWEIYRVLKPGAIAWVHHSNLVGGSENNWLNIAGRADMGNVKFAELSQKAGLEVVNQEYFYWKPDPSIYPEGFDATLYDGITTLQKPS